MHSAIVGGERYWGGGICLYQHPISPSPMWSYFILGDVLDSQRLYALIVSAGKSALWLLLWLTYPRPPVHRHSLCMAVLFNVLCSEFLCRFILAKAKMLGPTSKSSTICAIGPSLTLCCAVFTCRFILAKVRLLGPLSKPTGVGLLWSILTYLIRGIMLSFVFSPHFAFFEGGTYFCHWGDHPVSSP